MRSLRSIWSVKPNQTNKIESPTTRKGKRRDDWVSERRPDENSGAPPSPSLRIHHSSVKRSWRMGYPHGAKLLISDPPPPSHPPLRHRSMYLSLPLSISPVPLLSFRRNVLPMTLLEQISRSFLLKSLIPTDWKLWSVTHTKMWLSFGSKLI